MDNRKNTVSALVEFSDDLDKLTQKLSTYKWDSDPLVILARHHIRNILQRYLDKTISGTDVKKWADAVEMRDDIDYELGYEKIIAEILFKLSEPEINGPFNKNISSIKKQLE